jgi:predicted nuclease of predicted toxin-antitoxin system
VKIFVDHCVAKDVVFALRDAGWEVVRAHDVGMAGASDDAVFQYAVKKQYVLLTSDKDFANIKRFRITESCGVVLALVSTMSKTLMPRTIVSFFHNASEETLRGRLTVLSATRTRFWPERKG